MRASHVIFATTIAAAVGFLGSSANAAPVYIGLSSDGGATITDETPSGPQGSASISNVTYGNFSYITVNATGTPPLNEPDLNSTSISLTGSPGGTLKIYVTELNQFPVNFNSFESIFATTLNPTALANGMTVSEATYATACTVPNSACTAANIFATGTLLSQTTFSSNGSQVWIAPVPSFAVIPYSTTLVYTVTGATGSEYSSIDLASSSRISNGGSQEVTPLPAAVWLMGSVLGGGAAFGSWRRKRKNVAALAAA
jgi:hypothetical protein